MTKKYMVEYRWVKKPETVDVIKETEKTYTQSYLDYNEKPRERRRNKDTSPIFDTFDDAMAYLVLLKTQDIESARKHLERLNGELGNLKGLKEISRG